MIERIAKRNSTRALQSLRQKIGERPDSLVVRASHSHLQCQGSNSVLSKQTFHFLLAEAFRRMNLLSKASHGIKVSLRSHVRTPDKAEKKKKKEPGKKKSFYPKICIGKLQTVSVVGSRGGQQKLHTLTLLVEEHKFEGRLTKASRPDAAGRGPQVRRYYGGRLQWRRTLGRAWMQRDEVEAPQG